MARAKVTKITKSEKTGPDAAEFLKAQHREVDALFAKLDKTSDKAEKARQELFDEIAHKLSCHAEVEEKILYPVGKTVDADDTLEAFEEHDVLKSLIAKIQDTSPSDETFMAKCTVLKEVVQHHVEEEEKTYFPTLKKDLGKERMLELGAELKAAFEQLDQQAPEKMAPAKAAATKRKATK